MHMTAVLTPAEEGGFVAYNPETGSASQGESTEEAVANLREAVALYLGEFPMKVSGAAVVTFFDVQSDDRPSLKAMIDDGLASGVLNQDPRNVIADIIAEDPDLGNAVGVEPTSHKA